MEEINTPLDRAQVRVLRNQLDLEDPKLPQSQFNYAWALLKEPSRQQVSEGVRLLEGLYKHEVLMRREVLYYLGLGSFKVGEYANAKRYAEALLKVEPENSQAKHLLSEIEDKVTRDGLIGLGVGFGAVAVGLGVLGAVLGTSRRGRR